MILDASLNMQSSWEEGQEGSITRVGRRRHFRRDDPRGRFWILWRLVSVTENQKVWERMNW